MNNLALKNKKLFLFSASLCLFMFSLSFMLFIVENRRFVHEGNMMLDFLPSILLLPSSGARGMRKHPLVFR
jgi:hypothetical protein